MQEPPLATEFLEVPCEVRTAEIEKIGGEQHLVYRLLPRLLVRLECLRAWVCCCQLMLSPGDSPHHSQITPCAVDVLSSQKSDRMPLDSDSLARSIARLESSISQAHQYVDDVVVSIRPGSVGRMALCNDSLQR